MVMSSLEDGLSPVIPNITQTRKNKSVFALLNPNDEEGDSEYAEGNETDALHQAFEHIRNVPKRGRIKKKHLETLKDIAWKFGLSPEDIDTLLDVALSSAFGDATKTRLLKCLIPTTVIPESSVVKAVSRLCANNYSSNTKVIFFRWLIALFDFIDHKEELNSLYGFFFSFLQEESLAPYISNLLYLLTKKENVKLFRVRKLLELQSKVGMQPYFQALLSLYKSFCPDLITISLPPKRKHYFKSMDSTWRAAFILVRQRNQLSPLTSVDLTIGIADSHLQTKKWHSVCAVPAPTSSHVCKEEDLGSLEAVLDVSNQRPFPLEQLHTFPQLLKNLQNLELPAQMCSVLTSRPLLHYLNCIQDETVRLRLYYWMNQELKEGCTWYRVSNYASEEEFSKFLDIIINAQCFLQEGFPSSEVFLYRSLPFWDGVSCQAEYLQLLSWIPLGNFSDIKPLFCDSLAQLFFTSTIYQKCSILHSLKQLLQNWLLGHSVEVSLKPSLSTTLDTTMIALNSMSELINYVGWLSSFALRLEDHSSFLLHFILDFFEMVSDAYLNYSLPLLMIFPPGVFYPALLTSDTITLNHLCYIMYRSHFSSPNKEEREWL
ncbi:centromere protein I isoform X2 [Macrotis lagotis]|uniref:centromere protein I isoform X2 n=1 Tax=Macrotis lagotis TaxID=92651 RepID=UPI003D6843D0